MRYKDTVKAGIHLGMMEARRIAVEKGWSEDRGWPTLIALMHAELSEALEWLRTPGGPPWSDHIPDYTGLEEELADVVIRIFQAAETHNLRLHEAVVEKMEYNEGREPKHGGKKF